MNNIKKILLAICFSFFLIQCDRVPIQEVSEQSVVDESQTQVDNAVVSSGVGIAQYQNWIGSIDGQDVSLEPADLLARNFYLVFDGSGSMSGSKNQQARAATIDFINSLPGDVNLGLLVFDSEGCFERIPIQRLTDEAKVKFTQYVSQIPADGGTPLHDAIELSRRSLVVQAKRQLGYGEYNVVVITDGDAEFGQDPTDVIDYINEKTLIIVRTIGFMIGEGHALNRPGETFYSTAGDQESLLKALNSVLAEAPSFDVAEFK
ncbi:VWA domain-containing protein [Patescibacteria group bacterium]